MDFVLVLFLTGWPVVDNPSAGRFLGLDDVEADAEVEGSGFFVLCRFGEGGKAWFKIGSIPVEHISYVQTQKESTTPPYRRQLV